MAFWDFSVVGLFKRLYKIRLTDHYLGLKGGYVSALPASVSTLNHDTQNIGYGLPVYFFAYLEFCFG